MKVVNIKKSWNPTDDQISYVDKLIELSRIRHSNDKFSKTIEKNKSSKNKKRSVKIDLDTSPSITYRDIVKNGVVIQIETRGRSIISSSH